MLLLGLNFLPKTLAGKHIASVLPHLVLARHFQRLESFVTDITRMNPLSLLWFVPPHWSHPATTRFPSQTCPRHLQVLVQEISTPVHVLLKAAPCLEAEEADDNADPSVCLQLNHISVLQYFLETAGSMDYQHVLRQAVFLKKFLPQWLHCSGKQERVASGRWSGASGNPRKFMMLGLCVFLQYGCLTSSWSKEPWSRSCRWRRQVAKGTEGNLTNMTFYTTRLSSTIPYLLFPSISYSSSSSSFFSSSSSSWSSPLRRFGKPPGPPSSPAWTCRPGQVLASSSPRFLKI